MSNSLYLVRWEKLSRSHIRLAILLIFMLHVAGLRGTFSQEQNDSERRVRARQADDYLVIALDLERRGEYQQALAILHEALPIYQEIGHRKGEATTLQAIGGMDDQLRQYNEAINSYIQALPIFREIIDPESQVVTLINIGEDYLKLGKDQQASDYFLQAMSIVREAANPEWEAETLNLIGAAYNRLDQYQPALNYYDQALRIVPRSGDPRGQAMVLSNIGDVYLELSRYQQALGNLLQALLVVREIDDQEIDDQKEQGRILNSIGEAYRGLNQYKPALDHYHQALAIRQQIHDERGEVVTLVNIGATYEKLGQYQLALEYCQKALPISQKIKDKQLEAAALSQIGSANYNLSHYQLALSQYNQALAIDQEGHFEENAPTDLANLGLTYRHLGQYQRALGYYSRALPILHELGKRKGEGATLANIGSTYYSIHEYQRALDYFEQAKPISREIGDQGLEGAILANIAMSNYSLQRNEHALEYLRQAKPLFEKIGDRRGTAITMSDSGLVYQALGKYDQSLDSFHEALRLHEEVGDRGSEAETLGRMGELLHKLRRYPEAIDSFQRSVSLIEEIRGEIESPGLRMGFLSEQVAPAQGMAQLLADLADAGESAPPFRLSEAGRDYGSAALYYAERAKARSFVEILARSRREPGATGMSEALTVEEERLLSQQRATLVALQNSEGDLENNRKAFDEATKQLNEFISKLRSNPNVSIRAYAALRYPEPVRADQIPLRDDEVLLNYLVLSEETLLWIVQNERPVKPVHIPLGREKLRDQIVWMRPRLQDEFAVEQLPLGQLYDSLLGQALAEIPSDKKLVIVPDDVLYLLPFEALGHVTKSGWKYVGEEWALSYYPSASALAVMRSSEAIRHRASTNPLLAFGDPDYGRLRTMYDRLQATGDEVVGIAALFGMKPDSPHLKLRTNAREKTLKELNDRGELRTYKYIHFATHGEMGTNIPNLEEPALVLAPEEGGGDDGFLSMSEVLNLKLDADLVVLSACETGLGWSVMPGEGVTGLMQAFMYAGTPSVVVSLWKVADESTGELMKRFYANLLTGKFDKAEALREARKDLMKSYEHPSYWAPFVLVGER